MSAKKLKECPSCGSVAGHTRSVKVEVQGAWGEPGESTGWTTGCKSTTCIACGHRVDVARAEGEASDRRRL